MDYQQLSLMGQLAMLAAQDPAQFAQLAASKGITPEGSGLPGVGGPAAGGPENNVGAALAPPAVAPAMNMNPTIQSQMQQPIAMPLQQQLPPGMPDPTGATPTPQTAANDPIQSIIAGLGALKAPETPTVQQAPLAPAVSPPQARGGGDPRFTALIQQLLAGGTAAPAPQQSLGSIIGGTYRKFA